MMGIFKEFFASKGEIMGKMSFFVINHGNCLFFVCIKKCRIISMIKSKTIKDPISKYTFISGQILFFDNFVNFEASSSAVPAPPELSITRSDFVGLGKSISIPTTLFISPFKAAE